MPRIHITGSSGSGTTTLGAALASRLNLNHFDADDYFWLDTPVKYTQKRDVQERNGLLSVNLYGLPDWVHSGSIDGWNSNVEELFSLAVFLWVPTEIRLNRLAARELAEFGDELLEPGSMNDQYKDFMAWAGRYDTAGLEQRSKVSHEKWLGNLNCPILRIEGDTSIELRISEVLAMLSNQVQHDIAN